MRDTGFETSLLSRRDCARTERGLHVDEAREVLGTCDGRQAHKPQVRSTSREADLMGMEYAFPLSLLYPPLAC